ncbi:MAG: response regulator [Anaerolineales bacterium]|nr:response regulator [Anaerolineales bacterium]
MPKRAKLALIVAKPGHLWNGVQSLLRTLPEIEIIAEIKDPAVLLKMGSEMQPDLILVDANLFDEEIGAAITKIKGEWSQTQCIVLVEGSKHRQAAYDAGADLVVPQGFPATKLVAAIEELLSQKENAN